MPNPTIVGETHILESGLPGKSCRIKRLVVGCDFVYLIERKFATDFFHSCTTFHLVIYLLVLRILHNYLLKFLVLNCQLLFISSR